MNMVTLGVNREASEGFCPLPRIDIRKPDVSARRQCGIPAGVEIF